MQASDTLMFREAHESAEVVARQFAANEKVVGELAAALRARPPRFIVTCARGSSDHAAAYAKYVFETRLGLITASASPSDGAKLDGRNMREKPCMCIVATQ